MLPKYMVMRLPQQVGDDRGRAAIGDVRKVEPRGPLEQLAGEMLRGAHTGGAEAVFSGRRADQGDELLHVADRQVVGNRQDVGGGRDLRDRRQVLERIIAHLVEQAGIDDDLGGVREQQGVAVGRRLGDAVAGDVAAGARHVLYHDRLFPGLCQLVADRPRDDVVRPARHVADEDAYRTLGECGLRRRRVSGHRHKQHRHQDANRFHESLRKNPVELAPAWSFRGALLREPGIQRGRATRTAAWIPGSRAARPRMTGPTHDSAFPAAVDTRSNLRYKARR
jgi:hypothetical protein